MVNINTNCWGEVAKQQFYPGVANHISDSNTIKIWHNLPNKTWRHGLHAVCRHLSSFDKEKEGELRAYFSRSVYYQDILLEHIEFDTNYFSLYLFQHYT